MGTVVQRDLLGEADYGVLACCVGGWVVLVLVMHATRYGEVWYAYGCCKTQPTLGLTLY